MTDWEVVTRQLSILAVSIIALYVALQALAWNYITPDQFLLILWAILGAWGIGIIGTATFKAGTKSGYQQGYSEALQYVYKMQKTNEKKR